MRMWSASPLSDPLAPTLGVIGGGQMGVGIALAGAEAGVEVCVCESDRLARDQAAARVDVSLGSAVAPGRLSDASAADVARRVRWTTDLRDIRGVDTVVEAVYESVELK